MVRLGGEVGRGEEGRRRGRGRERREWRGGGEEGERGTERERERGAWEGKERMICSIDSSYLHILLSTFIYLHIPPNTSK